MFGYIYKITNLINGKIYIGKTKETIERRFYEHKMNVRIGKWQNKLYSAMKHYGVENFIVEEIDCSNNRNDLCEKEKFWIKELNSQDVNIGYNIADGGNGGFTWSALGYKTMNKDGKNTFVKQEDIDKYLIEGWEIGGHSIDVGECSRKRGKWMNNGIEQKQVKQEDIKNYLNSGFIFGRLKLNKSKKKGGDISD